MSLKIQPSIPHCSKRARYDVHSAGSLEPERWTLSRNELILHSVYDSGLGSLESDSDIDLDERHRKKHIKINTICTEESPAEDTDTGEEVAILKASLPENTLFKLSMGELNDMILNSPKPYSDLTISKILFFFFINNLFFL